MLQEQLSKAAQDITDAVPKSSDPQVHQSLMDTLSKAYSSLLKGDVTEGAALLLKEMILPGAVGLLGLIAVYFVAKFISRRIASTICKRVDETLGKFVGKITFYGFMIIACITILSQVGLEVSGFMAVLATAGFAIGLAFQGTLSNFSAGILLLVFRPFKVGDMVNIANVIGKVNEIDIFTTTLDTPDNRRIIVPNSTIASGTIENISYHPHRRVEVIVGIEYKANIESTRAALLEAVQSMSDLIIPGDDRGFQIMLSNLGTSSVDWIVRIWVAKENFFMSKEMLTSRIKTSLIQHQISIPFPQLHLHMSPESHKQLSEVGLQSDSESKTEALSMNIPTIHTASNMKVRPRPRTENADR